MIVTLKMVKDFIIEVIRTRGYVLYQNGHTTAYLIFCAIYLSCPFDLIPEAIFGFIGFTDDLVVVCVVLSSISAGLFEYFYDLRQNRQRQHNDWLEIIIKLPFHIS